MGLIDQFEKLINEHGSAAILREHLGLLKAEQAALERAHGDLKTQHTALEAINRQQAEQIRVLKSQLEAALTGNETGHRCDHCGSPKLKRTGARPNPTFKALGIKDALFTCADCGKESAFVDEPQNAAR